MLCIVGLSRLIQNLSLSHLSPALLYCIEVTDPSKSVLRMLNNVIKRAVYKIFNVSDKDSIADIRHFVKDFMTVKCCINRDLQSL